MIHVHVMSLGLSPDRSHCTLSVNGSEEVLGPPFLRILKTSLKVKNTGVVVPLLRCLLNVKTATIHWACTTCEGLF